MRNCLHRPGLRACLWIMLGNDLSRRTQPAVRGASPGQVMLGCRRKQAGQEQASKQHVAPPWPLLQLLLGMVVRHSSLRSYSGFPQNGLQSINWNKPSLPPQQAASGYLPQQQETKQNSKGSHPSFKTIKICFNSSLSVWENSLVKLPIPGGFQEPLQFYKLNVPNVYRLIQLVRCS